MIKHSGLWANNKLRLIVAADCNLACNYCHNEGQLKGIRGMTDFLAQHLAELVQYSSERLSSVSFSGGEPLLNENLENIVRRFASHSPKRALVTNGYLLTPERLDSVLNAGINKIRLGVDSLLKDVSRPSSVHGQLSKVKILEVIDMISSRPIDLELNIVLSKYNEKEIESLLAFCLQRRLSVKFFERVKVYSCGTPNQFGIIKSNPEIPFDKFDEIASSILGKNVSYVDPRFNGANVVYRKDGIEIRYCRFLCDYGCCYMSGTKVDANGYVYTCMPSRRTGKLNPNFSLEENVSIIQKVISEGCVVSKPGILKTLNHQNYVLT